MPTLSNRQSRCFAMGYSPQSAPPPSLRLGDLGSSAPRQIGTNQTRSYSILRYSGEISFRFIAAFRGAENSSEAMRSISLFNLRLSMLLTDRCVLFLCFDHRCVFLSSLFALYRSAVYGVFTPSISAQLRTALGPSHPSCSAARPNGKSVFHLPSSETFPRSSKPPKVQRGRSDGRSFNLSERYHHSSSVECCFQ